MKMRIGWNSLGVLLACLCCSVSWGQTLATSQVSGTVTDPTGAVVPNAKVQITRVDTGDIRTATSNASGAYILPDLSPGDYVLHVTATGFQTYVQKGIVLEVGTNPEFNVKLSVGAVTQEVVVQTINAQVETESNGVGQLVDSEQAVDLPLNGRDPDQLIQLSGAAVPSTNAGDTNSNKNFPTFTNGNVGVANGGGISVAGGLPNMMAFILDGGSHNEAFNNLNLPMPFPDALQEFKVETSSLPAQYGDHSAGTVNAVTKSGTNKFHGDAFEYLRNYAANAANFFSYIAPTATAPASKKRDTVQRNQFGGVIGGPIKKDKLFFFGGWESTIIRQKPGASFTDVPTLAMEQGDFSQYVAPVSLGGCQSTQYALAAPFVTTPVGGAGNPHPYPMVILPSAYISPQAQKTFPYIPYAGSTGHPDVSPTQSVGGTALPVGCGWIQTFTPADSFEGLGIGRGDYTISDKQQIFVRYFIGDYNAPIPPDPTDILNAANINQHNRDQSLVFGDTYIISSNMVNAVHLTEKRTHNTRVVDSFFDPSVLGINTNNAVPGYMNISITGGYSVGGGTQNPGHFNTTGEQFTDDLNYIYGNHQFAFGVNWQYNLMDAEDFRPANGEYTFNGQILSTNATTHAAGNIGYADFMAGYLENLTQGNGDLENDGQSYFALYGQDSYKLNRHLTINYGIRYEPYLPEHNSNDHVENFNINDFLTGYVSTKYPKAPAGMIFTGDPGMSGNHYTFGQNKLFAPRFGIVWDPFGDGKSTVRAGYGIFYDSNQLYFNTRYSNAPPFANDTSNQEPTTYQSNVANTTFANPWADYAGGNPFPTTPTSPFPPAGVFVNAPLNYKSMYMEQWNLSVQRQIGTWLITAGYIGNVTNHLPVAYEANPGVYVSGNGTGTAATSCLGPNGVSTGVVSTTAACSTTSNIANRRWLYQLNVNPTSANEYSTIGTTDPEGVANYNAGIISVQRRTRDINLVANYTYDHCLSEAETVEITGPTFPQPLTTNPNAAHNSYSNCDSMRRHNLNTSMILTTPRFQQNVLNQIATNWQWATIFSVLSGVDGTVTTSSDIALTGNSTQYSNIAGRPYATTARIRFGANGYLQPASSGIYTNPAAGTFGTGRPFDIWGVPSYELDTAISRTFRIPHTEDESLYFQIQAFNVTNEAIFTGAATGANNSGSLGNFTSAANPRQMQAAIKYNF
jgi:hypothetical protein